jgi:hypothetical protein
MTLIIVPKKPFEQYTESEQQAILSRGQAILSQKLEQGESRSLEDTWCMLAYQRTQREVKFKPTVEKIIKEKALTKAQKVEILEQVVKMGALPLTDKQQSVVDELVGKGKEYWLFTLLDGSRELMKMTKTNVKKKVSLLKSVPIVGGIGLSESEQEFLAMTEEVAK